MMDFETNSPQNNIAVGRRPSVREQKDYSVEPPEEEEEKALEEVPGAPRPPVAIGHGRLTDKGSFFFGVVEEFIYDVPEGTSYVSFSPNDNSSLEVLIGDGDVRATVSREANKARVCAWVNGSLFNTNELTWTVYAHFQ